jgi:hypothetical protein
MKISLSKISDFRDFIEIACKCSGKVTLTQSGYVVDGKSLMGVMSLNWLSPANLILDNTDDCVKFEKFASQN